jgi:peptidyl-prolyl cis-trans isomerase C
MKMSFTIRLAAGVAAAVCSLAVFAQGAPAPTAVVISGPVGQVTLAELELMAREMVPPARRAEFWSSADAIGTLARSLYAQRVIAQDALKKGLDKTGDGPAYLQLTRDRALSELLMQQLVRARMPSDKALDEMARVEYKARPERFAQPEQAHARHILLAVARDGSDDAKARAQAEDLLTRLHKGADFAELAAEYSADKGNAARGGDLGFFPRGRMVPEFDQAVFALQKKGDLSTPVKTQFGYHVIELIERKEAGTLSFEEALPMLREEALDAINQEERLKVWKEAEAAGKINDGEVARLVKEQGKK